MGDYWGGRNVMDSAMWYTLQVINYSPAYVESLSTLYDPRPVAIEPFGMCSIYKKWNEVSFYEEPKWCTTVVEGVRAI